MHRMHGRGCRREAAAYLPSTVPAEPGPESAAVLGPVASLLLGPELAARLAAEERGGALGGSAAACSFALPSTQHLFCR